MHFHIIHRVFSDINSTKVFLVQSPKVIKIKAKINQWNLIKLISFCTAMEIIFKKRKKRQATEWEKIFANDVKDKGLIYKIYKQLMQQQQQKPTEKWTEDLDRHFSKQDLQMVNRSMK